MSDGHNKRVTRGTLTMDMYMDCGMSYGDIDCSKTGATGSYLYATNEGHLYDHNMNDVRRLTDAEISWIEREFNAWEEAVEGAEMEPDVDAFGYGPGDVDDGYYQPEREMPFDKNS